MSLDPDSFRAKTERFAALSMAADHNGNLPRAVVEQQRDAGGRYVAEPGSPDEGALIDAAAPVSFGSADQGAASRSSAGAPPPGSYEHELAAAQMAGDTRRVMAIKNQRTREIFQAADPSGNVPPAA